jgi:hypothetical protein
MSASKNTRSSAPRKTSSTTSAYKGRVFPGGTSEQRFTLLIEKIALSVLGLEQFEAWNEVSWTKLSPTERATRRRETWARFTTALNDPTTADAVIVRLKAVLIDEPELFACLLDVVFSEFAESEPAKGSSPNRVLPPGLNVRRRSWGGPWNRTPWRHSTRTLARALGWPEEFIIAPPAGPALDKVLVEVLWRQSKNDQELEATQASNTQEDCL